MGKRSTLPIPAERVEEFFRERSGDNRGVWHLAKFGWMSFDNVRIGLGWKSRSETRRMLWRGYGFGMLFAYAAALRFREMQDAYVSDIKNGEFLHVVRRKQGKRIKNNEDADPDDDVQRLRGHHVAIASELVDAYFDWRDWCKEFFDTVPKLLVFNTKGNPLKRSSWNERVLQPIGEAYGVALSSHVFRDTAAQVCYEQTKSVEAVRQLMGHRKINTTEHYLAKHRRQAVDVLPVFQEGSE